MIFIPSEYLPPVTRARESVERRLSQLTQVANAWEVTYRDNFADILQPQADIETCLIGDGTTDIEQDASLTGMDEETWAFMAMCTCSRRLANDDASIRKVVEVVLHAIRHLLLSDITQGGVAINTTIADYEIAESIAKGYYTGTLAFHLRIYNSRPEPF